MIFGAVSSRESDRGDVCVRVMDCDSTRISLTIIDGGGSDGGGKCAGTSASVLVGCLKGALGALGALGDNGGAIGSSGRGRFRKISLRVGKLYERRGIVR